ncbi:hypothetical protein J6590_022403 [Homalodisca vitripennis]|nr:hypothetical protein J6590_022403 [Homalodisca vitripennis]
MHCLTAPESTAPSYNVFPSHSTHPPTTTTPTPTPQKPPTRQTAPVTYACTLAQAESHCAPVSLLATAPGHKLRAIVHLSHSLPLPRECTAPSYKCISIPLRQTAPVTYACTLAQAESHCAPVSLLATAPGVHCA